MDIPIYVAVHERRVLRGAKLLRVGLPYPRDQQNYYRIQLGIQLEDSQMLDFIGEGFDGRLNELPTGSSGFLTGLEAIEEPLPLGSIVMARVEAVGNPLSLEGTTVQAIVGWANAP